MDVNVPGPENGDVQKGRTRGKTGRQEGATPEDDVMQRGRTRGETARLQGGTGNGLLLLMATPEGIGHTVFYQSPPHDYPPFHTRTANDLTTLNPYAEARADEYSVTLERAMDTEHNGLANTGTFGEVKQPDERNIISAKWVIARTFDEHDEVVWPKAKLVARGFEQREGIDFFETFALMHAAFCVRMLGAIACESGLDLCY